MEELTLDQIYMANLEAERLRADPALGHAMISLRKAALEELVSIDATETDKIRDAQAKVRALDALATNIAEAIIRWKALPADQRAKVTE